MPHRVKAAKYSEHRTPRPNRCDPEVFLRGGAAWRMGGVGVDDTPRVAPRGAHGHVQNNGVVEVGETRAHFSWKSWGLVKECGFVEFFTN